MYLSDWLCFKLCILEVVFEFRKCNIRIEEIFVKIIYRMLFKMFFYIKSFVYSKLLENRFCLVEILNSR